ncbi:hypothetical protein [Agrobacterium vitis]|uniref:hypothetical protein n=1 Tax=Agrobacterium vitis TaxID=373 RepID=UPI001C97A49F|nr:hypothetical protein [Agrobacterium vitis]QZO05210.1 hypothetical protein K4831_06740 [Agrobacterium vitis]UJL87357.1 hypothetical protein AVF2S5_05075 [Agrobacterium vitis]
METVHLSHGEAINFINDCKRKSARILGMEQLYKRGTDLVLDNTNIVDFTMTNYKTRDLSSDADLLLRYLWDEADHDALFVIVYE